MNLSRSLDDLHLQAAWATVGMFDGVHRGHQAIIRRMVQQAHAVGSPAVVITFHPAPAVLLRGLQGAQYLTLPEERVELISGMGVDHVIVLEFTPQLSQLTAEEFVLRMVTHLGLAHLCIGYDFSLGRNRQGTLPVLQALGEQHGFIVEVLSPVEGRGGVISSSRIRTLLAEGQLSQVNDLLGRWFSLTGTVVHGDGRGHTLGIPTANLTVSLDKLLPGNGVYACWIWLGNQCLPAVVNIGVRPTFEQGKPLRRIEAHVLDFQTQVYDQEVRLDFVDFLRPEQRFENPQALVSQVHQDIHNARDVLLRMDIESGG